VYCHDVGSTLTLKNCSISNNFATGSGGGLDLWDCTVNVDNCLIAENHSSGGGGFWVDSDFALFTNCTIIRNISEGFGGAFSCQSDLTINNSIIYDNEVFKFDSEIYFLPLPTLTLNNCLYPPARVYPGSATDTDCIVSFDPGFFDIDKGYYWLLDSSPLIDTGNNIYTTDRSIAEDLDGATRIVDGDADLTDTVDIGAYEYQP